MPLIPLFPLGSVLFPGCTLPLHIFEERYKQMIADCMEHDQPFGVVLIRTGAEVGGPAVPHEIGTTARIAHLERLDDGRMNILTVGIRRFAIHSTAEHGRPYLQGDVQYLSRDEELSETDEALERVRSLYAEYYRMILVLGDRWSRRVPLPPKPERLADYIAGRLDLDVTVQQQLLEMHTVHGCLEMEALILAQAVAQLEGRVRSLHRKKFGALGAMN